jgi:DNA repair exonuclease SbcCD ATPase subunit
MKKYLINETKYNKKDNEIKLYKSYCETMNSKGLPYEIIKKYLPHIEGEVNAILHFMVPFNIEFIYHDETQIAKRKLKNTKANAGSVGINICKQNSAPYATDLASGSEIFIIGLAVRIALCKISLTAKPNFFIIDEGWDCLDNENLSNISGIMDYIKTQYEHIIIISHLNELKGQANYVINIKREKNFSHVDNTDNILFPNDNDNNNNNNNNDTTMKKIKRKKVREIIEV